MFTLKTPEEEHMEAKSNNEEDGFQTDDGEEMEVEKQVQQKRKKVCWKCFWLFPLNFSFKWLWHESVITCNCVFQVQGGGFQKKFRNNHWKSKSKKKGSVMK